MGKPRQPEAQLENGVAYNKTQRVVEMGKRKQLSRTALPVPPLMVVVTTHVTTSFAQHIMSPIAIDIMGVG